MLIYKDFFGGSPQTAFPAKDILIVEDDKAQQMILEWLIRDIDPGITFDWCASAEEAYDKLQKKPYRLVIADFMLEGFENGLNIWEYCRKNLPDCAFFLISSLRLNNFCEFEGERRPQLLAKPLNITEMGGMIRSALKKAG